MVLLTMLSPTMFGWFVPALCLLVCGCFLTVVLYFARVFLRDVKTHRKALSDIDPARFDRIQVDKGFHWLHWLYSQTRNPRIAPPARTEAMHEFDGLYFHRNDYSFVVKSREYAPFIGLLLTATAAGFFYLFELKNLGNASPGDMIQHVLPLLIGVAAGALLNLVCSGIVQYLNSKANAYRMTALEWFDRASNHARDTLAEDVQTQITAQITATNTNLADQLTRFLAQALARTEKVQQESVQLRQSALAATQAAEIASGSAARATQALERDISQLCQNLNTNITTLTDALGNNAQRLTEFSVNYRNELHAISESTLELGRAWLSLQPEIRTIAGGSTELAEATRTFREALGPAAETIRSASQQYAQITNELGDSAHAVHGATDRLKSAFIKQTQTLDAINCSVEDTLIPACHTLVTSMGQLEQNTRKIDQRTQQMATSLDAASTGLLRFERVSNSFGKAVEFQFLPAVASLVEIPSIVQSFRRATDEAGKTLSDSGSAIRQAFEDNRNHLGSASESIEKLQNLIKSANSAASGLNATAASFSTIIQNLQETSGLLSKVNVGLGPVPVQLDEFLNGLRNVATLSQNVDALVEHLRELDQVAAEAAKAQSPLADFAKALKEIQTVLRKIAADRPGIWEQVLTKLGLKLSR